MSDVDKKLAEIRERHELGDRWRYGPSLICPQSHEDRAFLLAEIERLRARVEVLERIRAAADNLFTYDSGWSHWEKKYRALRAALKEDKP
jgi:hypothetical protein